MKESSSKNPFSSTPNEVKLLIFSKLPIESVIKCIQVCKEWRVLISEPSFISTFNITNPPNNPLRLVMRSYIEDVTCVLVDYNSKNLIRKGWPLPETKTGAGFVTAGSYNGLIALCQYSFTIYLNHLFVLFNPFTKVCRTVCVPPKYCPWIEDSTTVFSGLCYNSVSDEYSLVLTTTGGDDGDGTGFLVVSFKDEGKWKTVTELGFKVAGVWDPQAHGCGITIQGSPHWMLGGQLVRFDPLTERFETVGLRAPPCGWGALGGQLAVAFSSGSQFEVWGFKDLSWSKLFVLEGNLSTYFPYLGEDESFILLSWRKGDAVAILCGEFLMIYDFKEERYRRIWHIGYPLMTVAFFPTLVSPIHH